MFNTDGTCTGHHGPEPVEGMEKLTAGYTGEKIFGATRVANHFMGKNRAADQNHIVVENSLVDVHGDPLF